MSLGMTINTGFVKEKRSLLALLEKAADLSETCDLWVNGKPFSNSLWDVIDQLTREIDRNC